MKSNRITIYVCAVLVGICMVAYILCSGGLDAETAKGLLMGVLTGAFISAVIGLIGYFHERETQIAKAANLSIRIYCDFSVIEGLIEHISPLVGTTPLLQNLFFNDVTSIAQMGVEEYNDVSSELFSPFISTSNLAKNYTAFASYGPILRSIALDAQRIELLMKQIDVATLESQVQCTVTSHQLMTSPPPLPAEMRKNIQEEMSNLRKNVAKQKRSFEPIARFFCNRAHGKDSWRSAKVQIENKTSDFVINSAA